MDKPLISIIIPVYNVEAYLERCLNSVVKQTYDTIEILAVNDGSTDRSLKILYKYQAQDARIKVLNKTNGGQASARNLGIKEANGAYLMMLDSDDYLDVHAVQVCVDAILQESCDLIVFDFYQVEGKGHKKWIHNGVALNDAGTVPWNKCYKKELWDRFHFPVGYWYEDLGIIPVIVAHAEKVRKIDQALYYYETTRAGSQTNSLNLSRLYDSITMTKQVYQKLKADGLEVLHHKELENLFFKHLLYSLLFRVPYINDADGRKNLIMNVKLVMDQYFPKWKYPRYVDGNFFTNKLVKLSIFCYLNQQFILGDLIWKYPKLMKNQLLGR